MNTQKEIISNIENQIYFLTINITGFLLSLKKVGIANDKTAQLANATNSMHKLFNAYVQSNEESFEDYKPFIFNNIEVIENILTIDFENINKDIFHEKATILYEFITLKNQITKL